MSNELSFAAARRQSRGEGLKVWLDGASLELYTTPRPATPDTAVTSQTLLVTFEIPDPSGLVTDGAWVGATTPPAMIAVNGTPVWGRFYDSADAVICDADVGVTGSGNAIELENVNLVSGAYVAPSSLTITEG